MEGKMKYFKIFSSFVKWYFILAGVSVTIFMFIVLSCFLNLYKLAVSSMSNSGENKVVRIDEDANYKVVSIDIEGMVYDEDGPSTRELVRNSLSSSKFLSFKYIDELVERISQDKRIQGVLLNIKDTSNLSSISIERLQNSFLKLKEAGKFLYASVTDLDTKGLMLASVADKRIMSPTGEAHIIGYNFDMIYLGDALKKLGVDINVVRMGEYKNAFEFLVANSASKETLEEYTSLGEEISSYYIENISKNMGIKDIQVGSWFKQSIFTSREAELEKMVEVGYPNDFLSAVIEGFDPYKSIVKDSTYMENGSSLISIKFSQKENVYNSIGIINLRGEIVVGEGEENSISVESFDKMYSWLLNPEIKGVVVKINSPGGGLSPSDIIWKKLKYISSIKPVVVSMQGVAASGGYYIASAANYIYAHPTTITGSIGVIGMIPRFSELKQKYGISFINISNSDHSNLLASGEKLDESELRLMQDHIRAHYNTFLERVVSGRGKDINYWDKISRGRVYLGKKALSLGLVDELGGEDNAVEKVKELVGDKNLGVVRYKENASIPTMLKLLIPFAKTSLFSSEISSVDKWMKYLKEEKIYVRLANWNLRNDNI